MKKAMKKELIIAIDPGISGAIILTNGVDYCQVEMMPIISNGKDKSIDFDGVHEFLSEVAELHGELSVYIERAIPMAQGAKSAFNYGRGFEALIIAIQLLKFPLTLIEPQKWSKEMHEGISADLKPKAKSLIAVKRLFPKLVPRLPTRPKGGLHDGPIDALLIAGYALRRLSNQPIEDGFEF